MAYQPVSEFEVTSGSGNGQDTMMKQDAQTSTSHRKPISVTSKAEPSCPTLFVPVQMPGKDRTNLEERQQNMLSCVNAIARRAAYEGGGELRQRDAMPAEGRDPVAK